jgi:hypothetical protein
MKTIMILLASILMSCSGQSTSPNITSTPANQNIVQPEPTPVPLDQLDYSGVWVISFSPDEKLLLTPPNLTLTLTKATDGFSGTSTNGFFSCLAKLTIKGLTGEYTCNYTDQIIGNVTQKARITLESKTRFKGRTHISAKFGDSDLTENASMTFTRKQ